MRLFESSLWKTLTKDRGGAPSSGSGASLNTDKLADGFSSLGDGIVGSWETFAEGVKKLWKGTRGAGGGIVGFGAKLANFGISIASGGLRLGGGLLQRYPAVGIILGAVGIYKAVDWFNNRSKAKEALTHEQQMKEYLQQKATNEELRRGASVPNMDVQEPETTAHRDALAASRQQQAATPAQGRV